MSDNKIEQYSFNMLEKEFNVIGLYGLSGGGKPQFIKNRFYFYFDNVWFEFDNLENKKYFKNYVLGDKNNDKK